MRIFALSDIHVDFGANQRWIANLSALDYRNDLLILAGDICASLSLMEWCLRTLAGRFAQVLYVPGNHDLWVFRDDRPRTSLEKFQQVCRAVENSGVSMQPFHHGRLSIVPLLGWYDYSFGEPTRELLDAWADYRACRWPEHFTVRDVAEHFLKINDAVLSVTNETVISFSHFVPRLDLMPSYIPVERRMVYPVLGSTGLERQIRRLRPAIHVYGHTHVNRKLRLDDVLYVNNAFGYPQETLIAAKELICIHEQ